MVEDFEALMEELFDGKYKPKLKFRDIEALWNQPHVYPLIRYQGGKPVAMLVLYVVELLSRKLAVIEEVVTLKEYRNQGIGSSLVKEAIEKAKELKVTCVELHVRNDRPEVQRFYENLGFFERNNKVMRLWINKR